MKLSVKYLPIINLLLLSSTLCTTLILTLKDAKEMHIPYISDTGTVPPASSIFAQSLNVLWILFSFETYIKYRQTRILFTKHSTQRYTMLNITAFCVGLLACLGCSIAANFQVIVWPHIHMIGTVLVLGFGAIYQCLQTMLYIKLLRLTLIVDQKTRIKLRIGFSVVSVITFSIFFTCAIHEGIDYPRKKLENHVFHNIGAVVEWICGACTIIYFTLFYGEFAAITLHEPDVFVEDESTKVGNLQRYTKTSENN